MEPEEVGKYLAVIFLICIAVIILVNIDEYYYDEHYYVQPQMIEPALITPNPSRFEISTEQLIQNQKDEFEQMFNRQSVEHDRQIDSLQDDISALKNEIDKMEREKSFTCGHNRHGSSW